MARGGVARGRCGLHRDGAHRGTARAAHQIDRADLAAGGAERRHDAPEHPDLDDGHINGLIGEREQCGGGDTLEPGRRLQLVGVDGAKNVAERVPETSLRDRFASETDPLGNGFEVWAGAGPDPQPHCLQQRFDHADRRALAVGARDVNDGIGLLGVAEGRHQPLDRLQGQAFDCSGTRRRLVVGQRFEPVERLAEAGLLPEGQSLYDPESTSLVHHATCALRAHKVYLKDRDYLLRGDEVVLVDEFTGRMMPGRRLSDGLHQAIEAKEGVAIQPENVTLASVTFQNYFRLYKKLGGMTGTAATEAEEFFEIYKLGVVEVPTNRPVARIDDHDQVYRTAAEKYNAIVESIREAHEKGQPVLVGTTSIEKSEMLSGLLTKAKLPHNVLNARQHEQEAQIVADAGKLGAITIATNMAGRGTDIKLGGNVELKVMDAIAANPDADPEKLRAEIEETHKADEEAVKAAGGLYVLATERHESRRIDNQLRGRSGRQGDPGRSAFYLSLEDDLMRIFGSERLEKMLTTLGLAEGEAIVHPWVNKSLERAQAKVEGRNFDIRKQLLKFDDVMNEQRKVIFGQRMDIMASDDIEDIVKDMRYEVIADMVDTYMPPRSYADQWDVEAMAQACRETLSLDLPIPAWAEEDGVDQDVVIERLEEAADKFMNDKATAFGAEQMRNIEKQVLLQTIDQKWRDHLLKLEHLRSVVAFRGYAQRDPLNEYKSEAFQLFEGLLDGLRQEVTQKLGRIQPLSPEQQAELIRQLQAQAAAQQQAALKAADEAEAKASGDDTGFDETRPETWGNLGRNDACPCGSGKKFKHCHGRLA